jgi:RNA polymerase sigma factor (sigma-70 family)
MVGREDRPRPLTPRQREILAAVLAGKTHKEIAFELGLSDSTVRVLYARAMKRLGRQQGGPRSGSR